MARFRLTHSDSPARLRALPEVPAGVASHQVNLEEGRFHHVVVSLEKMRRVPYALLLAPAAAVVWALSGWLGAAHAVALLIAQWLDWLALMWLRRRGISFGPIQTQWLMLALLRMIGAVLVGVLAAVIGLDATPVGIALQVVGIVLMARAFVVEPSRLRLSRLALSVPSLAPGAAIRLLHVADVHLERRGARERQLVDFVRDFKPAAVLFTGDFLNLSNTRDPEAQRQARAMWSEICALAPVYAVSGSPPVDPPDVVCRIVEGLPVLWLRDELAELSVDDSRLRIVGVTCTHDPRADGERFRSTLDGYHNGSAEPPFTILLYHAPDLAPQAAATSLVDLHLAGHTHGGQVRLPGFGALMTNSIYHKQLEMGLYRLADMLLYVSRGIGLEGMGAPRVRFLCPPELTLIELAGEP